MRYGYRRGFAHPPATCSSSSDCSPPALTTVAGLEQIISKGSNATEDELEELAKYLGMGHPVNMIPLNELWNSEEPRTVFFSVCKTLLDQNMRGNCVYWCWTLSNQDTKQFATNVLTPSPTLRNNLLAQLFYFYTITKRSWQKFTTVPIFLQDDWARSTEAKPTQPPTTTPNKTTHTHTFHDWTESRTFAFVLFLVVFVFCQIVLVQIK